MTKWHKVKRPKKYGGRCLDNCPACGGTQKVTRPAMEPEK